MDEWEALPWWQSRMYLEQLDEEMSQVHQSQAPAPMPKDSLPLTGDLAGLSSMGVSVRKVAVG